MAPNGTLTPKQETAAVALAGGATYHEAAEVAGVGRRTVARWWAEVPAFRQLMGRLRSSALEVAAGRLATNAGAMADRVVMLALEPSSITPRDRLSACIRGLTLARDLHQGGSIEDRLTRLEELVNGSNQ